jgi:hypothetical protein
VSGLQGHKTQMISNQLCGNMFESIYLGYGQFTREDRPPNSKFFPGSCDLVDYDTSHDYKQTRDYGRALCALATPILIKRLDGLY